ncbi:TULIP family P47-like protein [Bacillus cereus group sp. BceL062]|uniref:TULIP family P47-like protein n=1 Tax=Bacillus cereus group sp. BceL062 TaxID=3445166 RepID=UPI003F28768F
MVDTKGWDSLCIVSIAAINEKLNKQMNSRPILFNYTSPDFEFNGEFNAWKITQGGSGKFLNIETPIKNGVFKFLKSDKSFDLKDICPVLQIQLTFMQLDQQNNHMTNLEFNFNKIDSGVNDIYDGTVTTIDVIEHKNECSMPKGIITLLKKHLPELFINNSKQLLFTLGQIDHALPFKFQEEDRLTRLEYVYLPGETNTMDFLVICSSYSVEFNPTVVNLEIDTSTIDTKNDVYFILSEEMFLQNVIMHQLNKKFPKSQNSSEGNFQYVLDGTDNSVGRIVIQDNFICQLKNKDQTYNTTIKDFCVYVENNKIITSIKGESAIPDSKKTLDFTLNFDSTIEYDHKLDTLLIKVDNNSIKKEYDVKDSGSLLEKALELVETVINPIGGLLEYELTKVFMDIKGSNIMNAEQSVLTESFNETANIPFIVKTTGDTFQINDVELKQALCIKGIRKVSEKMIPKLEKGIKLETNNSQSNNTIENKNGWDTVSSVSFSQINSDIKKTNNTPSDFNYDDIGARSKKKLRTIQGDWDTWEITTESDDANIVFKCPIKKGKFINHEANAEFDISNEYLSVEVRLGYYDESHNPIPDNSVKKQNNLQIKTETDKESPLATIKGISFSKVFDNSDDPSGNMASCKGLFREYFNKKENLSFHQIFTSIIINEKANTDQFKWLTPTALGYSVSVPRNSTNLDECKFAVMAMTENRSIPKYPTPKKDMLIDKPQGGDVTFTISSNLFMEKWLKVGLALMQVGGKGDFELSSDGLKFSNKKNLIWANFQDENGKDCTATIQSGNFNLGIDTESDSVFLDCKQITWSVIEGITHSLDYKENFTIGTTDKNQITFFPKKNSLVSSLSIQASKDYQTRVLIKETIADIGFSILGGLVGGMFGEAIGGVAEAAFKSLGKVITGAVETAIKTGSATIENVFSKVSTVVLDDTVEAAGQSSITRRAFSLSEGGNELGEGATVENNKVVDKKLNKDILEINNISSGTEGADGEGDNLIDTLKPSKAQKENVFLKLIKTRWKMALGVSLGGALGGGIGEGLAKLDQWVDFKKEDPFQDLPTLDTFLNKCMENVKWPQSSEFQFKSIELKAAGGLKINGELIPKTKNS